MQKFEKNNTESRRVVITLVRSYSRPITDQCSYAYSEDKIEKLSRITSVLNQSFSLFARKAVYSYKGGIVRL